MTFSYSRTSDSIYIRYVYFHINDIPSVFVFSYFLPFLITCTNRYSFWYEIQRVKCKSYSSLGISSVDIDRSNHVISLFSCLFSKFNIVSEPYALFLFIVSSPSFLQVYCLGPSILLDFLVSQYSFHATTIIFRPLTKIKIYPISTFLFRTPFTFHCSSWNPWQIIFTIFSLFPCPVHNIASKSEIEV